MTAGNHTFVVLAYRDSPFLEECLKSLQLQTVPSAILISTSTPSPFLTEIGGKYNIEILSHNRVGDISGDWNFAYKSCKTKYLTLAHQDDIYLPLYTSKCLELAELKENKDVLIIFTDYSEIISNQRKRHSVIILVKKFLFSPFLLKNNFGARFIKRSILSFGNPISCPTVMFNTENIGPFEFSGNYLYNVDWEAWLRLAEMRGKFIYVRQKLLLHRIHNDSQTTLQISDQNRLKEEEKIFAQIWNKPIAKGLMWVYKFGSALNKNSS